MKSQGHIPPSASPSAHEAADLPLLLILRVATIIFGTLLVLILAGLLLFLGFEMEFPARTSEATPQITSSELPPLPRLQINPNADLQAVRASEDLHLQRYAWVDRSHGVAQIPIERAMAIWVKNYKASTANLGSPAAPLPPEPTDPQKTEETEHAP